MTYNTQRLLVTMTGPFLLSLLTLSCGAGSTDLEIRNGRLQIPTRSFEGTRLNGRWRFQLDELNPGSKKAEPGEPQYLRVPSSWNGQQYRGKPLGKYGVGTYKLELETPTARELSLKIFDISSSASIRLNGREIASIGVPAQQGKGYRPVWASRVIPVRLKVGTNVLSIRVANFSYHKGGLWKPISLGPPQSVLAAHNLYNYVNLVLFGALSMMCVYYFLFYLLRPRAYAEILLSLFCLCLAARSLVVDNRLLQSFVPGWSWELLLKIEFLSFYVGFPAFFLFIFVLVRGALWKPAMYAYLSVTTVLVGVVLVTSASFFGAVNPYVVIMNLVFGVFVSAALARATVKGNEDAFFPLLGGLTFLVAGLNDALKTREILHTPTLLPLGLFVFVSLQAFALSRRSERLRKSTEVMSIERAEMGDAMRRFVPEEFLRFLGGDLRQIRIGQAVESDLTVMFSDIRGFTRMSEAIGSRETMRFLNGYYQRANPLILRHNGFIDKFIGDGLMALFPGSPDDALSTAVDLGADLKEYNEYRKRRERQPIRIGIGINSGPVTLGTVGDAHRMDTTVVGDTVNLAARVEALNKAMHSTILLTANSKRLITSAHRLREVAYLRVRGKKEPVTVYECFDSDPAELGEQKQAAAGDILAGLSLFQAGETRAAYDHFVAAGRAAPGDPIPALHIERCRRLLNTKNERGHLRVLGVDDNPAIHKILEHHLTEPGVEYVAVGSRAAALVALKRQSFDVVVCDVHLEDGDGLDFVTGIRTQVPRTVLLTADNSTDMGERAMFSGIELFIKPDGIEALALSLRPIAPLDFEF